MTRKKQAKYRTSTMQWYEDALADMVPFPPEYYEPTSYEDARNYEEYLEDQYKDAVRYRQSWASEAYGPLDGPKTHKKQTPLDAMAWSPDPLVREIYSEIDDRDLDEIADAIMDLYFGSDDEYEEEYEEDPMRSFEKPRATRDLTKRESVEATILASQIVDWANYATSYGDYSDPPWER